MDKIRITGSENHEGMILKKKSLQIFHLQGTLSFLSGRMDSNHRPPGPKPGALTGLRYAPKIFYSSLAVKGGFEPPVPFPVRQFSKLLVSATHPPHQTDCKCTKGFLTTKLISIIIEIFF